MTRTGRWQHWATKNWLTLVIWVGTLLVANWVLLTKPIFYTHDYLHGARIAEMARGLLEGQWPVIWSQNFGFGFGMPIFEFYAPAPYLVGAIFYLLGCNLVWSTKLLFLAVNIGTMIGMYLWAREFFASQTASLAASFLTLASYRAMDLFARGAMSELWGIMAVTFLLAGVTRLIKQEKYSWWLTIFGGSLLCLSHNITMMLAAPLVAIYALGLLIWQASRSGLESRWRNFLRPGWGKSQFWRLLAQLALAAGVILLLTAFYWYPAISEKDLTQVDTYILDDYYDYHLHFLYLRQLVTDNFGYGGSSWGPDDGLSFFLGWAQWCGLLLSIGMWFYWLVRWCWRGRSWSAKKRQKFYNLLFFSFISIIFGFTIFMTLLKSQLLWDVGASLLAFTQFPWRFLGVSIIWLSWLAAWGLEWWPRHTKSVVIIGLWLLLIATSSHYFQGDHYLEPTVCRAQVEEQVAENQAACASQEYTGKTPFYIDDQEYIRQAMSPVLVDYLPRDFANYTRADDGSLDWRRVDPKTKVLNLETQPAVLVERMHEKLYDFDLEASSEVELAIAYYPGWTLERDGQPLDFSVSERGNITINLPVGHSRVGLYLDSTPRRRLANWLSGFTLIGLIAEGIYQPWQKKQA